MSGRAFLRTRAASARRTRGKADEQLAIVPDERKRWTEHQACFTPGAVALQGMRRLHADFPRHRGARILDLGAGAGVFGWACRQVFPGCHLTAVEPREEETPHLRRHYDQVHIMRAEDFLDDWLYHGARSEPFDAVVGNPPWDRLWGDLALVGLRTLVHGGVMCILGPSTWGHSDESAERIDIFDRQTPVRQWRVRGRIAFNGGRATDNRKCSWWVWLAGHGIRQPDAEPGDWLCSTLPALDKAERCWRVRPGTDV